MNTRPAHGWAVAAAPSPFRTIDRTKLATCETDRDLRRTLIGDPLAQAREEKGLSLSDVGDALGISKQAVDAWESGLAMPRIRFIGELCALLGIPPRDLIDARISYLERALARSRVAALRQLGGS